MSTEASVFDNDDQSWVEDLAQRLYEDPRTRALIQEIGENWRARIKPDAENEKLFPAELERAAFSGFMHAAGCDPLYPKLYTFGRDSRQLNGRTIPATWSAHPNPDYLYRFIAVDSAGEYRIQGRIPKERPAAAEYALLTQAQAYQKNISLSQFLIEPDGSFEISASPSETGAANHFQTTGESHQLLFRDVVADGFTQKPILLSLQRKGPKPSRAPYTYEEYWKLAETLVRKHVEDLLFVTENFVLKRPVNVFDDPRIQSGTMYSAAQAYSAGHFDLKEDEAILVDLTLAGAAYAIVPITNVWGGAGDVYGRRATLSTNGAKPNADGSYTFVISPADPGVENWVDAGATHTGCVFFRWIGLPPPSESFPPPTLKTQVVKLSDVARSGAERVTPAQRAEALARRADGFRRWQN